MLAVRVEMEGRVCAEEVDSHGRWETSMARSTRRGRRMRTGSRRGEDGKERRRGEEDKRKRKDEAAMVQKRLSHCRNRVKSKQRGQNMTGEKDERSERREKENDCPGRRTEPGTLGNGPDEQRRTASTGSSRGPWAPASFTLTIFTFSSPSILHSISFFLFQCSSRPCHVRP